jgi:adenine-specific DNA-methyltransferase
MPTLNWIGKEAVEHHHRDVPYRLIHCDGALSAGDPDAGNLLVQGDNLEALKALLPYYGGQVKCIYIDPPYNTGNEGWHYNDNNSHPDIKAWLYKAVGKAAEDLSRHDKWLCMMYPRLRLLREFLSADGLVLISVDDNEVQALRYLMDEVFGRSRFVAQFVWNTDGHTDNQFSVKVNHEYVVCYSKNPAYTKFGYVIDPNTREESNLWSGYAENSITKNGPRNPPSEVLLPLGFPISDKDGFISATDVPDGLIEAMSKEGLSSNPLKRRFPGVQFPLRLDNMHYSNGRLVSPCRVFSGWANVNKLRAFIKNDCKPIIEDDGEETRFYLSSTGVIYYRKDRPETARNIVSVLRNFSTTEKMRSEIEAMGISFTYPKPKELIKYLIKVASGPRDLILDSFAGSGTTAQAVLELNRDEQSERRFIVVELDEKVARDVTAARITRVISGYLRKGDPDYRVAGTDGGFRYCRLGVPLFNEFGDIDGEVSFPDLAAHVFFAETGAPIPAKAQAGHAYLGKHGDKAVYLLFTPGQEGVPREALGNMLTPDALAALPPPPAGFAGTRVVYAEGTTVSPDRLKAEGVVFKQIPYQIAGV